MKTAPPHLLKDFRLSLRLKNDCKIVAQYPNQVNIYLEKKVHLSNHHGNESYDRILEPIANELAIQRENYPLTIIYLKLKYCGYAYGLFKRTLTNSVLIKMLKLAGVNGTPFTSRTGAAQGSKLRLTGHQCDQK